jgi:hypothetical protein
MDVDDVAARIDAVAATIAEVHHRLQHGDGPAHAFAADGPGALGHLGAALHQQFTAGLAAREREAATASSALGALAGNLRTAAARYREVDQAVQYRHRGVG